MSEPIKPNIPTIAESVQSPAKPNTLKSTLANLEPTVKDEIKRDVMGLNPIIDRYVLLFQNAKSWSGDDRSVVEKDILNRFEVLLGRSRYADHYRTFINKLENVWQAKKEGITASPEASSPNHFPLIEDPMVRILLSELVDPLIGSITKGAADTEGEMHKATQEARRNILDIFDIDETTIREGEKIKINMDDVMAAVACGLL